MKLKIDYIQDFIDDQCDIIDCYPVVQKVDGKYKSINYPNKEAYIAEYICDTIFRDFEKCKLKSAQEVYEYKDYQSFDGMGFYIGIPYYAVECVQYDDLISIEKARLSKVDEIQIEEFKDEQANYLQLIKEFKTTLFNASTAEKKTAFSKVVDMQIHKDSHDLFNSSYCPSTRIIYYLSKLSTKIPQEIERKTLMIADEKRRICEKIEELTSLQEKYDEAVSKFNGRVKSKVALFEDIYSRGDIGDYFKFILEDSFYWFDFQCNPVIEYDNQNKNLIVEYYLPNLCEIPNIKEIEYFKTKGREVKYLSEGELSRIYDDFVYKITLRSIGEIFHFDLKQSVDTVLFNGRVESRNIATGQLEDNCILSVQVKRDEFEKIDLNYVNAKACFKHFKGVGAAKLSSMSAVVPIMETSRYDRRFRDSKEVAVDNSTNLAAMHWEDFEHLIRELFEKEFSVNGGEVKVTQASRDGGVDAIAFDPDPIRGGKIVIQAKRYTNTVGVSAVRDLYGTVINEGANKGILITTSDYGSDSYSFARAKPLTLLNGGHLLYLLEKHGEKARIDIDEAKRLAKESV